MTFDQLNLFIAISKVGGIPDSMAGRRQFVERVVQVYWDLTGDCRFPFSFDDVSDLAVVYRKRSPQNQVKAEIAEKHGAFCFWQHRGKGECSDEVEAGHILPASEGHDLTVANGVIECSKHNRERGTRTIEEYLDGKTTA